MTTLGARNLFVLWLVAGIAGTSFAQQKPTAVYSDAIDHYAAGDAAGAGRLLGSLSQRDIEREITGMVLKVTPVSSPAAKRRLEVAAMLHTEYALYGPSGASGAVIHIEKAHTLLAYDRSLVQRARAIGPGGLAVDTARDVQNAEEFLTRWFALATSALLVSGADLPARRLMNEAVSLLPDGPKLRFWAAAVAECQVVWHQGLFVAAVRGTLTERSRADILGRGQAWAQGDPVPAEDLWRPIAAAYERVLVLAPDNTEASLHLAYALLQEREFADASARLASIRDRSADVGTLYLTHLFLARVHEAQQDFNAAVAEYQAALEVGPSYQSAYLGLSLVESHRGNVRRARELISRFAAIPQQNVKDPWWAYHTMRVPIDDLDWLRTRVRG